MKLSRDDILRAVKCDDWQRFRRYLKGYPTERKLSLLQGYLNTWPCGKCDATARGIQVLNYLNALARGGQIKSVNGQLDFESIVIMK